MPEKSRRLFPHAQRYLMAGVITVIPLAVTWLLFEFIVRQLTSFGTPWVNAIARIVDDYSPGAADYIYQPWFQNSMAVLLTLLALYLLGWLTTRVIGNRLIAIFERVIEHIPFVQTIYGATKKLLGALQQKPDGAKRVVLIPFPSPDMRTVGLVTQVFHDAISGEELAAVYVPTTPNPTSGYLEIVPTNKLIPTDWSLDEAMTFVMSGGAVAPKSISIVSAEPSSQG